MPLFKPLLAFLLSAALLINPASAKAAEYAALVSLVDSGINGLISGKLDAGQALENAAIAALEAAAFSQVHVIKADLGIPQTQDIFSPNFDPVAALESASLHALVGCGGGALSGATNGGSVGGGCASGAAAAGIGDLAGNIQTGSQLGQFLITSLAGGLGAKIAGGDFATGALQGGFGYLFNSSLSMVLNGQPTTQLVCDDCGPNGTPTSYTVFSGNGNGVNNSAYANSIGVGPIPPGSYYIVDRPSGGLLGPIMDYIRGKDSWFALYSTTTNADQMTFDGVTREELRLHPVGPLGLSQGCVTVCSYGDFIALSQALRNGSTQTIPGTNIKTYGTLTVKTP